MRTNCGRTRSCVRPLVDRARSGVDGGIGRHLLGGAAEQHSVHTVLDYSDDCEMLEIIVPAKFDTVEA